ncbi:hypothetical protein ACET3Z_019189 [Daucus carota]
MEVFYKFKSAKDFDSLPIDWHYTTVSDVKDYVLQKKCSGKRNKFHYDSLNLVNADTDEEYLDGEALIPKGTYLIVRRAPRCFCMPIVIDPPATPEQEDNSLVEDNGFDQPSTSVFPRESEWVEFWNDLSPSEVVQDAPSKADVGSKISDRIKSAALNWRQCQSPANRFGRGGMGGRGFGRVFGKGGMSDNITPSPGYICRRCKVPGHFIQHCPTNGDHDFDIKRYQPPRGIPNSMLMASADGSYVLPGGGLAVLKPDESAFEKEMQGIPSMRSAPVLPAELHCPICKAVMKDAVLASKCCLETFCDKCIRDYIMSNSLCTCGAKNVLADDLIPNNTVRNTIVQILESTEGSGTSGCSAFSCSKVPSPKLSEPSKEVLLAPSSGLNTMVEEMTEPIEADKDVNELPEAVHECAGEPGSQICPPLPDEDMQPKIQCSKVPSPSLSAPLNGIVVATKTEENTNVDEILDSIDSDKMTQKTLGKGIIGKDVEVSEAAEECTREPRSQMCPAVTDEEMQKPTPGEAEKKRKKFTDMQSSPLQDCAPMPLESSGYSSYWKCMQTGYDGFGLPYWGQIPFMNPGLGSMSIPFGSAFHYSPFGAQHMMPVPPQRDLAKFGTGFNGEFCSWETSKRRKRDHEKHGGSTEVSRNRNCSRDMISHDQPREKKQLYQQPSESESVSATRLQICPDLPPRPSKYSTGKSEYAWKRKASVLSGITNPEGEMAVLKKRKLGNSFPTVNGLSHHRSHSMTSNQYHKDQWNTAVATSKNVYEYADNHDDDNRHFKRRPSKYEKSPVPVVADSSRTGREWTEKRVIAASVSELSVF